MVPQALMGSPSPASITTQSKNCQNYGRRCWTALTAFERLWEKLTSLMDANEDGLLAYTLDQSSVPRRRKAGQKMVLTQLRHLYLV